MLNKFLQLLPFSIGNDSDRACMSAKSGLQKEVLSLYRRALRMALSKPVTTRPKFILFVRYTFREQAKSVSPRDVSAIEHLLRRGNRQVEAFEDEAVRDCFVTTEMRQWACENGAFRVNSV